MRIKFRFCNFSVMNILMKDVQHQKTCFFDKHAILELSLADSQRKLDDDVMKLSCRSWKVWIQSENGLACTLEAPASGVFTIWCGLFLICRSTRFDSSQDDFLFASATWQMSILTYGNTLQVYEILDNAIDEVQSGFASNVKVRA